MLIYVCCVRHVFQCLNTDSVGSTNTINIYLILWRLVIYSFISVSGCVGIRRGPCTLLCPGAYNAVKTALLRPTGEVKQSVSDLHVKWSECFRAVVFRFVSQCHC
jgi:hypothetical protein